MAKEAREEKKLEPAAKKKQVAAPRRYQRPGAQIMS
jgi:hypothetical protein